ncbi:MAG: hypothetical protein ACK58L_20535 [Planctomycetota bacterium]
MAETVLSREFLTTHPLIEQIPENWQITIGPAFEGYRGHVDRILNLCRALHRCGPSRYGPLV